MKYHSFADTVVLQVFMKSTQLLTVFKPSLCQLRILAMYQNVTNVPAQFWKHQYHPIFGRGEKH